jgi:Uma2 family endonuclease
LWKIRIGIFQLPRVFAYFRCVVELGVRMPDLFGIAGKLVLTMGWPNAREGYTMSVMAIEAESDYELWLRDELADVLGLPDDGTRVEIIWGETVVSPGPKSAHSAVVADIQDTFATTRGTRAGFRWRCLQGMDLDLSEIHNGYIPDLCVLDHDRFEQVRREELGQLRPHHLALAVEVTSPSNAAEDRRPGPRRKRPSKWNGYGRVGIGHYLIVDRGPGVAATTLYTMPDTEQGGYRKSVSWKFGETIELPEPFGVSIRTDDWTPWD